jgi:hypothetical protein
MYSSSVDHRLDWRDGVVNAHNSMSHCYKEDSLALRSIFGYGTYAQASGKSEKGRPSRVDTCIIRIYMGAHHHNMMMIIRR